MSNKYMLTIQHDYQKVAYVEFRSENDNKAKEQAERIFNNYQTEKYFQPTFGNGTSGNFSGIKPRITGHWVSKWVSSEIAVNAWGQSSGGYWSNF